MVSSIKFLIGFIKFIKVCCFSTWRTQKALTTKLKHRFIGGEDLSWVPSDQPIWLIKSIQLVGGTRKTSSCSSRPIPVLRRMTWANV